MTCEPTCLRLINVIVCFIIFFGRIIRIGVYAVIE